MSHNSMNGGRSDAFFLYVLTVFCCTCCSPVNGNILEKCGDGFQEMSNCVQFKVLRMLDRLLLIQKPISLAKYVYLTHEADQPENDDNTAVEKNYTAAEKELLETADSGKLTETLMSRISSVAKAKSLQISLDPAEEIIEEGRKKDKKGAGMMMMMMMGAGAMMVHAGMGMIALIAGKALLIAKIALVISGIIGLKKLVGQDDQSTPHAQVIYAKTEGHGGGGWQHRSMDTSSETAHNMAYSAHFRRRDP